MSFVGWALGHLGPSLQSLPSTCASYKSRPRKIDGKRRLALKFLKSCFDPKVKCITYYSKDVKSHTMQVLTSCFTFFRVQHVHCATTKDRERKRLHLPYFPFFASHGCRSVRGRRGNNWGRRQTLVSFVCSNCVRSPAQEKKEHFSTTTCR